MEGASGEGLQGNFVPFLVCKFFLENAKICDDETLRPLYYHKKLSSKYYQTLEWVP